MIYKLPIRPLLAVITLGLPIVLSHPVLADSSSSVAQVQSFIESIIKVIAGLSGLVATVFFVVGGYQYITSSGNPEHLNRAKRTLLHAAVGLSIVLAAFVLANIVTGLATTAFGNS